MPLLCLIAWLATPPVTLTADRLDLDPQRMRAEGVRLGQGALQVATPLALGQRSAACPRGDWILSAPVTLRSPTLAAQAHAARFCAPSGRLQVTGLAMEAPGGRLSATRATLTAQAVAAEGLSATACACADPPWRVTASSASITQGSGAWLTWPVLRLGDVPVMAAPAWYVPLARRRSGLLAPRLGFDAEDGPYGTLPIFLTLGQSADLTLAPGWRDGPLGGARLRWAATPDEGGAVRAQALGTDGVRVFGDGSLPLGGARFAVDGELTSDRSVRQRLARTLLARSRDHLRAAAVAHATGELATAGMRVTRLHDLSGAPAPWIPEAWLGWTAPVGPLTLLLDGRFLALRHAGEGPVWLDLDGQADSVFWLGPLRLRPVAGAATTVRLDTEAPQTSVGWAGIEAEALARRAFGGATHFIGLRADARAAEATGERPRSLPFDAPGASRAAGLSLINRLVAPDLRADLTVRVGTDREQAVDVLSAHARVDAGSVRLSGSTSGVGTHWSEARVEVLDGIGLRGGHARVGNPASLPSLWSVGTERPWLLVSGARDITTASAGAFLRVGRLAIRYDVMVDARAEVALGQWGAAQWDGRCDCWRVGVQASHERGRPWPDVLATVELGRL